MDNLKNYQMEERPWGTFERFTLNEASTVKILTLKPNESLSLQTHEDRDEFWHIIAGSGVVQRGDTERQVREGDDLMSSRHTPHRATAGPGGLQFLEIAFGTFDEHDETRLSDQYGRA